MSKTLTSQRLPLVGIALGAIVGILTAEYLEGVGWFAAGVAGVSLLLMLRVRGWFLAFLGTAAIFTLAHTWQWNETPSRIWSGFIGSKFVGVTGILVEEPVLSGNTWRATMRTESWKIDGRVIPLEQKIIVRWKSEGLSEYGDRWTIEGLASQPEPPRNPGAFDVKNWLARQGIFLELRSRDVKNAVRIGTGEGSKIKVAALGARNWIMRTIGLGIEPGSGAHAVIAGITLGAREDGVEEFTQAFRQTGTMHLFAVSGLHVGMFALLLWIILRPLGFSRRKATLLIIPMLFFYSLVTGAQPSSLRAATMISIALGGFLFDRPASSGNSLAAAALVLLGFDTNQLFLPGFQLSFCVVASIILLAPVLDARLSAWFRPDAFLPRKLYTRWQIRQSTWGRLMAGSLSVSAASWIGSLPLTVGYFHIIPVIAIVVNIIAVPLAFAILSVSMLSMAGGLLSVWLASVFNHANWALASLLLIFVQWSAALPGAWFQMPPDWMQPPVRLTVFDLSTGGAQLLRTQEQSWLIDSGTAYDFERIIEPSLRAAGVAQLNGIILTHGDAEHVGGVSSVLRAASPRRILDSILRDRSRVRKALHAHLAEQKIPKQLILSGDSIDAGNGTSMIFLSPSAKQKSGIADDQAVVTRVDSRGCRILLMSDSGVNTEDYLLRRRIGEVRADVLVFGRHRNDLFASTQFLNAVRPRVIILAAPDPFRDGSSEPALRKRLKASGVEIFDQQECGAVIMTSKNEALEIAGFFGGKRVLLNFPD